MNILLSPHDDDSVLFAAATCMREKPVIVIVADSYIQPARGEVGCSAAERADESARAHALLGCISYRMQLRDDDLTIEQIRGALVTFLNRHQNDRPIDTVYTPALEGGHAQHDMTTLAAIEVFGAAKLRCYSTYARHSRYFPADLQPVGTDEIVLTESERHLKHRALGCFESQLRVNLPHFQAVDGRSEWLSNVHRLHLGCGEQQKLGWLAVDRVVPSWWHIGDALAFTQVDLATHDIPAGDSTIDYVFSEDFLEHLPPDRRVHIMNEIHRVLVPNGVMEHYLPNAGSENAYGSPTHLSHWNLQTFEHFDVASRRFQSDRVFEGIVGGFAHVHSELVNVRRERDGTDRAQGIHVRYRAVKP